MCQKRYGFIYKSQRLRSIDGFLLTVARQEAGISQEELARRVQIILGRRLSRVFITQLESLGRHEVNADIAYAIYTAIYHNS